MSSHRVRAWLTTAVLTVALAGCGRGDETNSLGTEDGLAPVEGISPLEALALYVLVPALILVVVTALVWLPGMVRSSRYRPGRGWDAPPLWFGGPPDPAAAVQNADLGDLVRGGASGDW